MKSQRSPRLTGRGRITLTIGAAMMGALALLALLAPVICRYDPVEQDLYAFLQPPGGAHPFGTDQLGRDVFSRVLHAARTDLRVMALAEIGPFFVGVFLGMLSGYFGGWVEWTVTLATDTFIAFPYYLLVIVVAFATGAGIHGIFITFMLVGWLVYARVARGVTASLRGAEWVASARLTGYLGIGLTPPPPDWGSMIAEGQTFMTTAWWLSVIPGLMVVYTGIGLSFIGDGLADVWR